MSVDDRLELPSYLHQTEEVSVQTKDRSQKDVFVFGTVHARRDTHTVARGSDRL